MLRTRVSALFVTVVAVLGAVTGLPVTATAAPAPPGSVISSEDMPRERWLPGAGQAQRITYATTDHVGAPATSTGALYLPPGRPPVGGWPVVSYAHGTIGVADQCAPSSAGLYEPEADYLGRWLNRGYAVVVTDYLGLGTPGVLPYLDGRAAAHSVIDMVRAGRAVEPDLAPRWVVVGLSEGGQAALLTAHEATRYAPDLDYRGAVALGAPANLEKLFPLGGPGFPDVGIRGLTTFGLFAVVGLRAARPDLDIDQYLSPLGLELAARAEQLCSPQLGREVDGISVGRLFSRPLDNPEMRSALTDYLAVPTDGYDRPLFVGHGLDDVTVPIPLTLALAADLERAGTDLTFVAYPGTGHVETLAASFADSTRFVDRVMG
ncbi:prolyl oligopeptidase family serine peptidase [Rhodococcus spelaei]|uniref:Prolyl oligopeptidase family serine peptidase n=1 Tax=Rhodococcus spelaei TaxID=2546320 RepID=A0A541BM17_9NOCA|nr:lipase family protein [Rhodococcus spelaei]TQF73367.1 prolyl oligopeptidase family serine peptidase [Rhodococcus spelaei]